MRCGSTLVQHIAIQLSLFKDIRPSTGRPGLVPLLTLLVPLGFAKYGHVGSARVIKGKIKTDDLTAQDDLIVVDHLDTFYRAHTIPKCRERGIFPARILIVAPQGVIVDQILCRKFAVAMVKLHALV
jgi:hypothetical protein